jgi:hypothetical protein
VSDIIKTVEQFARLLDTIETDLGELISAQSSIDLEQQDILHEIELTKFNAVEGFLLASKLKEIRHRRREITNDLEVCQSFVDSFYKNHKGLGVTLYKSLKYMQQIRQTQGAKVYTPRVRTDIKLASAL